MAIAALIGIPLGVWSAASDRVHRVTTTVADTLQTLPSFVYLIPVVMLFQVGDFSAMVAIVLYALAPALRYTDRGIRGVPAETIEAARMCGCTPQIRWRVQLPLALPEIMLGLNQTIMMALSMLVITALVGTGDLGQEVYIALTRADIGARPGRRALCRLHRHDGRPAHRRLGSAAPCRPRARLSPGRGLNPEGTENAIDVGAL
ncbi:MAG: ABC transporter permease subunit [Arhodomonas sp.]|nr:ABC transporter permease subunit [Arhodomonas sp.]